MTQFPGTAPLVLANDGPMPPEVGCGLVEEGDVTLSVRGVDGDGHRLQQIDGRYYWNPSVRLLDDVHLFPARTFLTDCYHR